MEENNIPDQTFQSNLQKTEETIHYEETIKNLTECIVKLNTSEYEYILNICTENFDTLLPQILKTFEILLLHIPGNMMILALFIDIATEKPELVSSLVQTLVESSGKIENLNNLLTFFTNLYFFEFYGFIKYSELYKILEKNDLLILKPFFVRLATGEEIVQMTKRPDETNLDTEIPDILINKTQEILDDVHRFVENYNLLVPYSENESNDILIAYLIIENFSFNGIECKENLLKYFYKDKELFLILGILLHLRLAKLEKTFLYTLFIRFTKEDNFLKTFYSLYPKLIENTELNINFHLNTLMAFLFERYYKFEKKNHSLYVKSVGYDPNNDIEQKKLFFELLNTGIINEIQKFSDLSRIDEKMKSIFIEKGADLQHKEIEIPEVDINLSHLLENYETDVLENTDRTTLFLALFKLGSPSITHFLTYLEKLLKCMKLSLDDQNIFCNMFQQYFSDKKSFKKFVAQKLVYYNVVEESVRASFPNLFIINDNVSS
ncbi:hypothetical protein EDEG_01682 [Edhazardia aedis USNM 41457]|uniref:Uncharacterized protein n=1 Tax=Edhazardia aedis (strain USNM 41457) TaxID=1003232 RepID=J8ZWM1_EDHAE|nr:hypothetical protein EDEG_01682 [Edhazardia aedis USNM 41457]|eukprot:EJW04048.1 hypothetical protein EDEG_01682 [Edhazardia aedis USNM 41457]